MMVNLYLACTRTLPVNEAIGELTDASSVGGIVYPTANSTVASEMAEVGGSTAQMPDRTAV